MDHCIRIKPKEQKRKPRNRLPQIPPTDFHEDAKAISHHTSNNLRMNHRRHWELSNYKECREKKREEILLNLRFSGP